MKREPALYIGLIGSVLTFLVSLNLSWIDAGAAAAILALITGGVTAVFTRPVAPALYSGLVAAVAAVLAEYAVNVPDSVVSSLSGLVLAPFALFGVRTQVTPSSATVDAVRGR